MKKAVVLLVIILLGCSKPETVKEETYNPYAPNKGGVYFSAFREKSLSTGETINEKVELGTINIWDATNRDFDVDKSSLNIVEGYLFDKNTGKSIKAIASFINTSSFYETLPEGKYFIYVLTASDAIPKLTSSYAYFSTKYKKDITLKKVFKEEAPWVSSVPW